jgi:hypothetical protein
MKKLITLIVLTVNFTVNSFGYTTTPVRSNAARLNDTIILFPDANFKNYLVGNLSINTSGDNEISIREAWSFKGKINISNISVTSVLGIEYFSNVKTINCSNNSNIDSITYRFIGNNKLDSLILKNCGVHDYVLPHNLKYLDISGNGATTQVVRINTRIQNSNTIILADSVISSGFKVAGYSINGSPTTDIYNSINQQYYSPDFYPVQFVKPFTCTSIIGLTNIYTLYDKVTWNTGDTTTILFNKCSGVYTATLSYQGSNMRIYTFNVVDTTITISNPSTYPSSLPLVDSLGTNPLTITCPSTTPTLYGYKITTVPNASSSVDTIVSFVYQYQNSYDTTQALYGISYGGLYNVSTQYYCYSFTRSANAVAKYVVSNYVFIDLSKLNQGTVVISGSNSTTSVESIQTKEIGVTIAPNPFITSTKISIDSDLTNVTINLINLSGSIVLTQLVDNNNIEINRNNLASGLYFLQIISNNEVVTTKKIIIQ